MIKYFHKSKRKPQHIVNQATAIWIEDLEDLIILMQNDLEELKKDLEDLTDFVEDNLD